MLSAIAKMVPVAVLKGDRGNVVDDGAPPPWRRPATERRVHSVHRASSYAGSSAQVAAVGACAAMFVSPSRRGSLPARKAVQIRPAATRRSTCRYIRGHGQGRAVRVLPSTPGADDCSQGSRGLFVAGKYRPRRIRRNRVVTPRSCCWTRPASGQMRILRMRALAMSIAITVRTTTITCAAVSA
jgi:hypothetical protein